MLDEILHISKDQVLIREGEASKDMYWLKKGSMSVRKRSPTDDEIYPIRVIHEGEIFGELAFVDNQPRCATIVALESCEVLRLDYHKFKEMLSDEPKWIRAVMVAMAHKLRETSQI
ncbi:MAG: cyclic nucleotide-binding domain-containing protein [Bacteriovoracaceae bacterium]|nr:cyclic nucleotide-binding domain-containing protein [Bacteriovoracaceae bacterium]